MKEQLQTRIASSPESAFKIGEPTNVAGLASLHVFVRCCFEESIQEDFVFCLSFSERCTWSYIFEAVSQQKILLGQAASASVQTEQ
jgi:hypothetical protein